MVDKVNPSFHRPGKGHETATAIAKAGGGAPWVVPSTDVYLADEDVDLDETAMNAFAESHSGTSYDVTIDPGEAFLEGAWVARDSPTTVTLSASTNNQTVFVGWDRDAGDTVIIGTSGAFGANDPKTAVWEFDTDGSGVTAARDQRNLDVYRVAQQHVEQGPGSGLNADKVDNKDFSEIIPSGTITIWSGSISNIPAGWVLCDGNNGTPNLQDKFVVGAGTAYAVGATGGADSVALATGEMPSHDHGDTNSAGGHSHPYDATTVTDNLTNAAADSTGIDVVDYTSTSTTSKTSGSVSGHTHGIPLEGSGNAHENRPPFHALAYIMKT